VSLWRARKEDPSHEGADDRARRKVRETRNGIDVSDIGLTRRRVELHQAIWNTLFPSYSLDKACQRAGEQGTVAVVNEVQLLFFQGGSVGVSNPPVHVSAKLVLVREPQPM
jgi:hypothetical protein